MNNKDYKSTFIAPGATILDAMKIINNAFWQIALVVDKEERLLGTVTDGDIRRTILSNVPLDANVIKAMNDHPVVFSPEQDMNKTIQVMKEKKLIQLPILDNNRRIVGLQRIKDIEEKNDNERLPLNDKAIVILMLGGEGKRLRPLTEHTPKPMLDVGDKPLLETIIRNFANQGFKKFFFSINYKGDIIQNYFGDGSDFGVEISYLREDRPLGTAGSLSLIPERQDCPLIVMNGDLLTNVSFRHLLDFHRQNKAQATMCVREYCVDVPYGVVENEGTRFGAITEKPTHTYFVNAGIYVLNPSMLNLIPENQLYDMPSLFEEVRGAGEETAVFPIHEYWLDIGRIEDLERARSEYTKIFKS